MCLVSLVYYIVSLKQIKVTSFHQEVGERHKKKVHQLTSSKVSSTRDCVLSVRVVSRDCVSGVCPVLCSQRGEYINGECQCNPGWKGKECSLRHDECEVPDCSGHGHCSNGKCACARGFKGKFCEEGERLLVLFFTLKISLLKIIVSQDF